MTRILVLGGTGFIGTHLVDALLERGHEVNVLLHKSGLKVQHKSLKTFKGDVLNKNSLTNAFENIDVVINLVGQITSPSDYYALNSAGVLNVLEKCVENQVKKIVFTSSVKVYGSSREKRTEENIPEPISREGIVKLMVENLHKHYSKNHNIPVICMRLSNVYGAGQRKGVVFNFVRGAKKGTVMINGDGEQERSLVHVDDVVAVIISAIELKTSRFEVFNISSDKTVTINKLLVMIFGNFGKRAKVRYKEPECVEEKLIRVDYSKAKRILGYKPKILLKEGIRMVSKTLSEEIG